MRIFNRKELTANFRRVSSWVGIDVYLPRDGQSVQIHTPITSRDIARFGERELSQIVTLLEAQKNTLMKERNYLDSFDSLLMVLKRAVEERYGGLPKE